MIPILVTQFAQAGLGLIDTIMAGQFSPTDLAAIAVGVGLWLPVMLLFSGIMIATTPLVAEANGARTPEKIATIARQSLWVAFILGWIACLILQLAPLLLPLLGVPESLQPKAGLFLHAIGFGMPAVTMYAALRGYSEALGYPRPVTVISLLALVVLVPLNLIFMYGLGPLPELGSAGCGFATAILQWLMFITLALYISKSSAYQSTQIFTRWEPIDRYWMKRILMLGLPIGLAIFFEVSIFSTAAIVISPLGETLVAAHQIAMSVTSQLFMIPMSLAIALTIRIGTYYGEKNWAAMRRVQYLGLITATLLAFMTMSFMWLFRPEIISIYTSDVDVAQVAMYLLLFAIAYQLMDAWQISAAGCLRGMQDTKGPMWITMLAYWVIAFPVGVYFSRFGSMGAAGVWVGLIVGLSVACVLLLIRLYMNNQRLSQSS
ncbi:MATE family efflux transporter [Acinetobacter indicus]|uniref:Multidrug-efflux transporter n=1 Tax=Acinetobacter indicus TaxID=756892 RepID=A0A6C0Y792_9GAMM|nr:MULTISPECIES: MATE family efflux transporter [Acinetobacter]MDO4579382.1 MATE family efflux transporter [Acinetobacter sp.]MDV4316727.1 MATE family efflux transporter [Acinetobacter indicus]NOJ66580.1 MATE family efflux transporter [Acinetobacter indicus]QFS18770.1 MATE family efflux transporter [Acinetobacter indicus]QIC71595.1 MATE family efflux transporter [Acinetobacter indicus]